MERAALVAAENLACAVCATLPAPGKKLQSCELCKQRGLPATYYCSEACQEQGWPTHRAFHKEQKRIAARLGETDSARFLRAGARVAARTAERSGSKSARLIADGAELMAKRDYRSAARKFREVVKLEPLNPSGYFALGAALGYSGDQLMAYRMFLQTSELAKEGTAAWASAIASAFDVLRDPNCRAARPKPRWWHDEPKPQWWRDDALKPLSARVVAHADDLSGSGVWLMRAWVLSGMSDAWEAGPRTADELRQAARLFRRTSERAELVPDKFPTSTVAEWITMAAKAAERAEDMEAAEASARAEAEASAAEARVEAEAEAEKAAEALLAEVEAERAAAAAAAKPAGKAKAKAKGKRAKGGR